jgi:hypothetical protein
MNQKFILKKFFVLMAIIAVTLLSSNCDGLPVGQLPSSENNTGGTQLWIEHPQNGQVLPNDKVTFVTYATAADGVSTIQLKLNGEALPVLAVEGLSSDGSNRMVRLEQEWMPQAEGEYTLVGENTSGASNSITFCIVSCNPEEKSEPTATKTQVPTEETPTPTPTKTETATPTFTQTSTEIPSEIPTKTSTNPPLPTHTFTPWPTNTATPTEEYIAPADSSGPTVNSIGTFWEGCSIYGEAYLSDPSGVSWAEFWFNKNEEGWAWILMNQYGDQWVSQVGIDTAGLSGNIEYKIRTEDSLYNESWSSVNTMNYEYCGN